MFSNISGSGGWEKLLDLLILCRWLSDKEWQPEILITAPSVSETIVFIGGQMPRDRPLLHLHIKSSNGTPDWLKPPVPNQNKNNGLAINSRWLKFVSHYFAVAKFCFRSTYFRKQYYLRSIMTQCHNVLRLSSAVSKDQ